MTTRCLRVLMCVALTAASIAVFATPASAGFDFTIVVDKVVDGDQPPGVQYELEVTCASQSGGGTPASDSVTIDGPTETAIELSANYQTIGPLPIECEVSEPETGGATPSFTCESTVNASVCSGSSVVFTNGGATGLVTFTVTNTFVPVPVPEPAPLPLEITPAFTG